VSLPLILLLGGTGQVGRAVQARLAGHVRLVAPSSVELPLTAPSQLVQWIHTYRPHGVVNAAAYTRVDDAEREPLLAQAINAEAPGAMAAACRDVGARFVHLSTDYVFDGCGTMPYRPDAVTNPLNVYGASKRDGEAHVLAAYPSSVVVRTAWVHSGGGTNFVGTAVQRLLTGQTMRVVEDQVGTPTHADTVAAAVTRLLQRPEVGGMQHLTDAGAASWYDVACCVLDVLRDAGHAPAGARVEPCGSADFPRPAVRPRVSLLDCQTTRALLQLTPVHWRDGVGVSARAWLHQLLRTDSPRLSISPGAPHATHN
jgi:dTDP-4-dehydrorhamnose reductase